MQLKMILKKELNKTNEIRYTKKEMKIKKLDLY